MVEFSFYGRFPEVGTPLVCPVCKKEFKATDDTRYVRAGGYVCTWKCFLSPKKEDKDTAIDGAATTAKEDAKIEVKSEKVGKKEPEKAQKEPKQPPKARKNTKKEDSQPNSLTTLQPVELF